LICEFAEGKKWKAQETNLSFKIGDISGRVKFGEGREHRVGYHRIRSDLDKDVAHDSEHDKKT
jgi:hypothetical protein